MLLWLRLEWPLRLYLVPVHFRWRPASHPWQHRIPEHLSRSSAPVGPGGLSPGSTTNNNTKCSFLHGSTRTETISQRHRRSALEMIIFLGRELICLPPGSAGINEARRGTALGRAICLIRRKQSWSRSRSRDVFVTRSVTRSVSAQWRKALFPRRSQSARKLYRRGLSLRGDFIYKQTFSL